MADVWNGSPEEGYWEFCLGRSLNNSEVEEVQGLLLRFLGRGVGDVEDELVWWEQKKEFSLSSNF